MDTVDVILLAAARIFSEHGWAVATTNRIARVAGVSVGSLYQYFPNKLALLAALKARHLVDLFARLEEALVVRAAGLEQGLRGAVRSTLEMTLAQRPLLLILAEELPARLAVASANGRTAPHRIMLREFFERNASELLDRDPELAALVVGELVDATTRSALRDRPEDFRNGRLERELMAAVMLYLTGRAPRQ